MASEQQVYFMDNNLAGKLNESLGSRNTNTSIKSLGSHDWSQLRPIGQTLTKDSHLREILEKLDQEILGTLDQPEQVPSA